jgi:hypothetical protein
MPDVKDFSTAKAHETNIERVVQLEAEQERRCLQPIGCRRQLAGSPE